MFTAFAAAATPSHAACLRPKLLPRGLPRGPEVSGRNRSSPKKGPSPRHKGLTDGQGCLQGGEAAGQTPYGVCGAGQSPPQNPTGLTEPPQRAPKSPCGALTHHQTHPHAKQAVMAQPVPPSPVVCELLHQPWVRFLWVFVWLVFSSFPRRQKKRKFQVAVSCIYRPFSFS